MAKPTTHKSTAKPEDKHAAMLKTAAVIVVHMQEDAEDPGFLPLVKYSDIAPFGNAVTLLLNSPQKALVCDLPKKWVHFFGLDQQEELAALSALPEEDEEEDKEEKKFKVMLSGFLTSLGSLASPLVKAKKGKAKAMEMMPAKSVMPCLDNGMNKTLPVTRAHRRPMEEDSHNAGWMPEEMLVKVLLATMDATVLESFVAENCCTLCCKHTMVKDGKAHHKCDIADVANKVVCSTCKATKKPCSMHTVHLAKAMALPAASVEDLFLLETPEPKPVEETAEKPTKKKKRKLVHSYAPVKPEKCEQEDDEDSVGPSQKWSHLLEAEVELPVVLLCMVEPKMLELWKSLHTAQKAVDAAQKAMDTVTGWADQVQTLLGRALAE
ncbi:hypothetical protein DACRYDRAFT_103250 [Dacryopinax primogenitus]|uniref:Uncharacterized protein n=1 Tax=Dacryopinax primogenitus (strain DJM 731) TaxID=1858805 RepID=M5GFH6_DACPD|nr:uncharacterized protein DACRYDRAFT_103250 [Dacryopinax primogenitus]EJU06302.1 hypothetical protein DACRYDRAFT_103250 [Dacryopinax primogenitus]